MSTNPGRLGGLNHLAAGRLKTFEGAVAMKALPLLLLSFPIGLVAAASCIDGRAADAAPSATAGRDCFNARNVFSFRAYRDAWVDVRVSANRRYRLELTGVCPEVDWTQRIALRTRGGSSWICQGFDAELIVPSPTGPQLCPVTSVRRLAPAEVEAARRSRR